jgi:hypothetical protein
MATPTFISISVDRDEYSRYEEDKNTITVSGVVTGGAPYNAEHIVVELIKARRNRNAVVAATTVSITSNIDPHQFTASFYLSDLIDQDEISLVRFGKYFVRATSVTDNTVYGESPDFDLSIISVDRFKSEYLFGIELKASEVLGVKFQPNLITGVTVGEISKGHAPGFGVLTYNYTVNNTSNATATIGSGTNGTVTITANGTNTSGSAGNSLVVDVIVPTGTSPLSSSFLNGVLTVSLDVTSGVPNALQNTATLVANSILSVSGFTAVASGTGATALSVASGPTQFAGGLSTIVRLLSWRGGDSVAINKAGSYVLKAGSSMPMISSIVPDYITVKVGSLAMLPGQAAAEELLIEKAYIQDEVIQGYIRDAVAWVERDFLSVHVEPANLVTDIDPTTIQFSVGVNNGTPLFADSDYDFVVSPLTFFRGQKQNSWLYINMPHQHILRIDSLFGAYADTRIVDIDVTWIQQSREGGGMIQLVPYGSTTGFDQLGLAFTSVLLGTNEVPNFWHYNGMFGLRDCYPEIRELIGRRAAIRALTVLGAARRPGIGSMSHSRDGVSQSLSYTSSQKFGIFTGAISAHEEWIEKTGKEIKSKVRGIWWAIV